MFLKLSENLRNLLLTTNNPVAKNVLAVGAIEDPVVNYLDALDPKQWTYISKSKLEGEATPLTSPKRQRAKVATIVNKLFPKQFSENEVRAFVEWYKSVTDVEGFKFHTCSGKQIGEIYRIPKAECSIYTKAGTRLHSACFQGNFPENYDELYENNKDIIEMVYVTYGGKLDGRALIITGEEVGTKEIRKFMTNLQYSHVTSERMIKDYVKEHSIVANFNYNGWTLDDKPYKNSIVAKITPAKKPQGYLDNVTLGKDSIRLNGSIRW